jgi:hypothetical protein
MGRVVGPSSFDDEYCVAAVREEREIYVESFVEDVAAVGRRCREIGNVDTVDAMGARGDFALRSQLALQ